MRSSRFFAALTAALLLVVCSGCGADDKHNSSSTISAGSTRAKVAAPAVTSSSANSAAAADKPTITASATIVPAIDCSLVSPEQFAAIVVRPRRIVSTPLVAEQLRDDMIAGAIKRSGIDPSEIEQVIVLLSMDEKQAEPSFIAIAHFTHDVDAKEFLTKMQVANKGEAQPITEIEIAGKTCLVIGAGNAPLAYAPSKRTIVLVSGAGGSPAERIEATKKSMETVLAGAEPKGPLLDRLKKADADNDLVVVLERSTFPHLPEIIKMYKKDASPLAMPYLEAAKTLLGATVAVNLTGPSLVRAVLETQDAESAASDVELLEQGLRMAGSGLTIAKQNIPEERKEALDPLMKLADQFIDGGTAVKSGSQITLNFKRPELLNTAGSSIVNSFKQTVMGARSTARKAVPLNNMQQIGLAMCNYEMDQHYYPPAVIVKDGKPLLSWRVSLLPYLDQKEIYDRFHLDEPWDSPHNLPLSKIAIRAYQSSGSPPDGKTRIMVFTGKGAAFDGDKKVFERDIQDGLSMTIMCVEAGPEKAVPWSKPEDLPFDPERPLAVLGTVSPKGILAAFFDGHVQYVKADNKKLKGLITPNGFELLAP